MSDATVRAALRSEASLVTVEAPAGCGKTHQGADYAREIAGATPNKRLLILTHTHAARSVFSEHTKSAGPRVAIRTIDSLITQIASAYHAGLGLPSDATVWVRQRGQNGYAELAGIVANLLERHPMIAASLAQRYPVVICDEHQDSSGAQHTIIMALHSQGSQLRIFGDPMQKIFKNTTASGASAEWDWDQLTCAADAFEQLDEPHRWSRGCVELGKWTLKARDALKSGGRIDLRGDMPPSIRVVYAENQAKRNLEYQLFGQARRPIDTFTQSRSSLLVLTHHNRTARSLRSFFYRRIQLWEGHTRYGLDKLVEVMRSTDCNPEALAAAFVTFMGDVGKGFSPSAFGDRFKREVSEGCTGSCRGKPATIQELAQPLVDEPNHHGVAKVLCRLAELTQTNKNFKAINVDCQKEFWDAIRLGEFQTADEGLAEISHRRAYSRPKPPPKAISTIHKAKGLECDSVILMPCDAKTFPNSLYARRLLYVALTRAKRHLMLVVSNNNPSPLFSV